ncbi:2'(,)3'-cyclic-nucleotide 2'-phosphodiesterase (5'-nucleotidase family) [Elusimicrobium simillimum]|uniref:bifunctional metallophosphatase/5'-nucleotidase n=1 Tax=Elusimicrobium simillimum TaxID=3143438 RepID=UPI003C702BE0
MKKLLIALLVLALPFSVFAKELVIYHTSDTHGFFYPEKDPRNNRMWGGFAAVKNVVKKEALPHIFLDSGDYSNGTAEVKNTKGKAAITMMNAMGYQATTIGNHEFDFGEDNFLANIALFTFPVLNANVWDARTKELLTGTAPYKIFIVDGIKIAVIGIGKDGANKHFKFKNTISTIKKMLPEIKTHNPDVIVLLIHDSYGDDREQKGVTNKLIAEKIPEINVVLGGHAHKEYQNLYVGSTLLAESGANLKTMSKIMITLDDKTGKYKSASSQLISLYIDTVGEDAEIKTLAESLRIPGIDTKLGSTAGEVSKFPVKDGCMDSPVNNWVADLMAKHVRADFAMHNVGGARISLPAGDITMRDMVTLFPFDNKIALVEVDGKFIKNLIRNSIKNGNRALYNFHGLTAKFKLKNKKVKNLEVFINGIPVDDKKTYTMVTNEYIANGNTEGWMFKKIEDDKKTFVDMSIRGMLVDDLKEHSPLIPLNNECRLQVVK